MAYRNSADTWGRAHPRMPVSERAKQFMPFAAVSGIPEAVHEKERILIPRPTLSEDQQEELNRTLTALRRGDMIAAYYFRRITDADMGEIALVSDRLQKLDTQTGFLILRDCMLSFADLLEVQRLSDTEKTQTNECRSEYPKHFLEYF